MTMLARALSPDFAVPAEWPCGSPPLDDVVGKVSAAEIEISADDARRMDEVVAAVHDVVAAAAYEAAALAGAPPIVHAPQRIRAVFSGFDFHLTPDGPKLIEINTNAGGAFYGALIDDARWRRGEADARPLGYWAHLFVQHFRKEWQLARGGAALRSVAVIDDTPDAQFLRLEFHLAARMLHEAGIAAVIADPRELSYRGGKLWRGTTPIDLVYNRLTSFALDREADRALHDALLDGAVVVSPDPRMHSLLACKENLIRFGDEALLRDAGIDARRRDILMQAIPRTVGVSAANADALWEKRAGYYFKPRSGFGSRAVYDGAKVTAKTWCDITSGREAYVAQTRADASRIDVPGAAPMRFDVRSFGYGRETFMRLARVYRGQTTNFRTPGGGFAPVRVAV
jgi:hypothetical protein